MRITNFYIKKSNPERYSSFSFFDFNHWSVKIIWGGEFMIGLKIGKYYHYHLYLFKRYVIHLELRKDVNEKWGPYEVEQFTEEKVYKMFDKKSIEIKQLKEKIKSMEDFDRIEKFNFNETL